MRIPRRVSKWMLIAQAATGMVSLLAGLAAYSLYAVVVGFGTVLLAYFMADMQDWP